MAQHFLQRGFQRGPGCFDPLDVETRGEAEAVLGEQVAGVGGSDK
jgi:hypothetical protein